MQPMNKDELRKAWQFNLTNHTPDADGITKIESNRKAAIDFANTLIDNCPTSRDLSLALTSLEVTLFHANGAIAREKKD